MPRAIDRGGAGARIPEGVAGGFIGVGDFFVITAIWT
jgi:hypothetical protein